MRRDEDPNRPDAPDAPPEGAAEDQADTEAGDDQEAMEPDLGSAG